MTGLRNASPSPSASSRRRSRFALNSLIYDSGSCSPAILYSFPAGIPWYNVYIVAKKPHVRLDGCDWKRSKSAACLFLPHDRDAWHPRPAPSSGNHNMMPRGGIVEEWLQALLGSSLLVTLEEPHLLDSPHGVLWLLSVQGRFDSICRMCRRTTCPFRVSIGRRVAE